LAGIQNQNAVAKLVSHDYTNILNEYELNGNENEFFNSATISNDIVYFVGESNSSDSLFINFGDYDVFLAKYNLYPNNLGMVNKDFSNEIYLFPNPTENMLNIKSNDLIECVSIYDQLEREVYKTEPFVKEKELALSLEHLSASVYTVKITTTSGVIQKNIILK
jgi:Secretion system C-terminal sorting domain